MASTRPTGENGHQVSDQRDVVVFVLPVLYSHAPTKLNLRGLLAKLHHHST